MFERFVFVKLKDEWADAEGISVVLGECGRVLPSIPGVLSCRAGVPAAEGAAKGWDLCIALRFDSIEAIESYRIHDDHVTFLEEFLVPKVEAKRVWNFETTEFSPGP